MDLFMANNARARRGKVITVFFELESNKHMQWADNSSDFNPVDHLSGQLKQVVFCRDSIFSDLNKHVVRHLLQVQSLHAALLSCGLAVSM